MMGRRASQTSAENGESVATYATYEAAQKAVSTLIAGDVSARDIAIVGRGLRSIERVTGRLGYAAAARTGAINGLLLGLLFSAILVLGSPSVPIQAFVGVLFVGVAIGMLMSIVAYSLVRRRRDFASVMQVVAHKYEVTITATSIHRARQVLGVAGAPAPAPAPAPGPSATAAAPAGVPAPGAVRPAPTDGPPRYGERVPPEAAPPEDSAPPHADPEADDADAPDPAPPENARP